MPEANLFLMFTQRLNTLGVAYMVSGSVAVIIYGQPRLTHHVGLMVALDREHIARLPEVFPPEKFYCPPMEVVAVEVAREQRGHFNIIHHETGFKADVYLSGRDPLHAWGLARARQLEVEGQVLSVAPPEYVIVRFLRGFFISNSILGATYVLSSPTGPQVLVSVHLCRRPPMPHSPLPPSSPLLLRQRTILFLLRRTRLSSV